MRNLSSFNNEFVFGMGWIDQWMDLDDDQVRYVIKNPTFKKPDKNVLFKDLKIVSKEDHINLFLSKDQVNDYIIYTRKDAPLEKYEKVTFSGVVKSYRRKNGSFDFGIHPSSFFDLHWEMEDLNNEVDEFHERDHKSEFMTKETLRFLEYGLKPKLHFYRKKLEDSGNQLPTFVNTYQDYVRVLEKHLDGVQTYINMIRTHASSRKFRRIFKIKNNFSSDIIPFEISHPNHVFTPN